MTDTEEKPSSHFMGLSVMMFVIFFTWGAWFAGLNRFMFEAGMVDSIGSAYSMTPIAAIVTPFFIGIIADRFMNAEKLQGICLILSSIFMALMPTFASAETSFIFLALLMLHTLCFMPVLSLSNTIALTHLSDTAKDFPRVAMFRTFGWIVAGLSISFIFKFDTSAGQCYVAAVAALIAGIHSFFLPATPPSDEEGEVSLGDIVGAGTFKYFKKFSFTVFMFASLLICAAFMPYWAQLSTYLGVSGIEKSTAFLTWGQGAEVIVLFLVLPIFLKRFGIKATFAIGIACWIIRYYLFSMAAGMQTGAEVDEKMVMIVLWLGIILHGFSYDFVFISGFLYVDQQVDEKVRAQAQGLLTLFTQGVAFLISSKLLSGYYFTQIVTNGSNHAQWQDFWFLPVGYLTVILFIFLFLFKDKKGSATEA